MITKGIVEKIVDRYHVKVRIPTIDRTPSSSIHTNTENLNTALICTLSNCNPNIQIGDVVFVALDDQSEDDAIILGYLYREVMTPTYCDLILNRLNVESEVALPKNITIGDITYTELSQLIGANKNLQQQITSLQNQLDLLTTRVTELGMTEQ